MKINLRSNDYNPLDEIVAMPSTRVMRVLARRGWVSSEDLHDALGTDHTDKNAYRVLNRAVAHLVRDGRAERRVITPVWHELRLTDAGRAELDRRMHVDENDVEWEPARPGTEHLLCA